MKLSRSNNAKKIIITGMINNIFTVLMPFVLRTVMIYYLGIDYLGLNTLFTSLLGILSVAELGFGSTMIYNMYKPVAENDIKKICSLLNYYKKWYRNIGIIILALGLAVLPFLEQIVTKDVPTDVNLTEIYILSLFNTVISYLLFGYKTSILTVFQSNDIIYLINIVINCMKYVLEITLIFIFKKYMLFICVAPLCTVANNVMIYVATSKYYPNLKPCGNISEVEKKQISRKLKDLFAYTIGGAVTIHADTLVITHYLGLNILGKYQLYYAIISALFSFFQVFYNSIQGGVGNLFATESNKYTYNAFKKILLLQSILCGLCVCCLSSLYQPFITLWAGNDNLLPYGIVILLCMYFYQWKIRDIVYIFKMAGGMWSKDRYRPLVSAAVNFTMNIILVQKYGLYGVIFSTIISAAFIDLIWSAKALFNDYFKVPITEYIKSIFASISITSVISVLTNFICSFIRMGGWVGFGCKTLTCFVCASSCYTLIYKNKSLYKEAIKMITRKRVKTVVKGKCV